MKRWLVKLGKYLLIAGLIAALAITGLALTADFFAADPGYVLIALRGWTIELSVAKALIFALIAFLLCYAILRGLLLILGLRARLRRWGLHRREQQTRVALDSGLRATAQGLADQAERHFRAAALKADHTKRQAGGYSGWIHAAEAAHAAGHPQARDEYLAQAAAEPHGALPALIRQVELQQAESPEDAERTLTTLREQFPDHRKVLLLETQRLQARNDDTALLALLPKLRRRKVLQADALAQIEYRGWLAKLAQCDSPAQLERYRQTLPRSLSNHRDLAIAITRRAVDIGAHALAADRLRQLLAQQWDAALVDLFIRLNPDAVPAGARLTTAEAWLRAGRENDPQLLYAAGIAAMQAQLWGKARNYLEAAIARDPAPRAHAALGALLTQLGETQAAAEQFRMGLDTALAAQNIPQPTTADAAPPTTALTTVTAKQPSDATPIAPQPI